MDNKRAREIIRDYEINGCGICHQGDEHEITEAFNMAIKSLEDDWIDVRDRLPEPDKDVLVEMKDKSYSVAKYHVEKFNGQLFLYWIYNDFNKYYCDDERKEKNEVIAWKYIKPYKEGKENE